MRAEFVALARIDKERYTREKQAYQTAVADLTRAYATLNSTTITGEDFNNDVAFSSCDKGNSTTNNINSTPPMLSTAASSVFRFGTAPPKQKSIQQASPSLVSLHHCSLADETVHDEDNDDDDSDVNYLMEPYTLVEIRSLHNLHRLLDEPSRRFLINHFA